MNTVNLVGLEYADGRPIPHGTLCQIDTGFVRVTITVPGSAPEEHWLKPRADGMLIIPTDRTHQDSSL